MSDLDPIFNLERPAIFGHRGGAGEAPESTIESFLHTLKHGGNILEFDVQLTQNDQIVVWHGPELDIAFNEDGHYMKGQYVHCWKLADLKQLYVRDPDPCSKNPKAKGEYNRIISLEDMVNFVNELKKGTTWPEYKDRPIHMNIELKEISNKGSCDSKPSWTAKKVSDYHPNLHQIMNILDKIHEDVRIVVGSGKDHIIKSFRKSQSERENTHRYKTNLAFFEQAPYIGLFEPKNIKYVGWLAPLLRPLFKLANIIIRLFIQRQSDLRNITFETPSSIVTAELVQEIHKRKGGVYVFLSAFPALNQPELEKGKGVKLGYKEEINALIKMGVDGLMSDYPSELEKALKKINEEKK